ncbi:hypothetical protein F2Q69_00055919 [Brassica cretica]|uniref:Uncharacterized protein n=1 Tax=Brassica cretica TaxID=69181 RepID=A0A8S9N804_BRACR|nr:hypothetical protein F2Q69_00055919 [Brassica cretica]
MAALLYAPDMLAALVIVAVSDYLVSPADRNSCVVLRSLVFRRGFLRGNFLGGDDNNAHLHALPLSLRTPTQISPVVSSSSGTTITVIATNPAGSVISFMLLFVQLVVLDLNLRLSTLFQLKEWLLTLTCYEEEICGDYEEVTRSSMVVAQGLTSVLILLSSSSECSEAYARYSFHRGYRCQIARQVELNKVEEAEEA